MTVLYETDKLILEHHYGSSRLREKSTANILLEDEFYGEPECGLIDLDNKWAIVAGEHLTLWTPQKTLSFQDSGPKWVHSLRATTHGSIEILTDPWGSEPAVWELDITTLTIHKARDFFDYQGHEYSEEVTW